MEVNKKREQFAISIRRKQTNARIQSIRSLLSTPIEQNIPNHNDLLSKIVQGQETLQNNLRNLKILSWKPETAKDIFDRGVHRMLCLWLVNNQSTISNQNFKQILNVLINMCVHTDLDISSECMKVIADNFKHYERQMSCFWFIANIIYQKSQYSMLVVNQLINNCGIIDFLEKRMGEKFQSGGDIIIFNFFVCSFLVVSSVISYADMKRVIGLIQEIQQFQAQKNDNFYFFSEAIIDHATQMNANGYIIFQSPLMAEFHILCKAKKTKFIKNYLKMLIVFTGCDPNSYEKMLNYGIFTDLDFCLQNRFPEIKGLCAQIGCNLLDNFTKKVDIDNIGFFAELSTSFLNFQKYNLQVQVKLLKFSFRFFKIAAQNKTCLQQKNRFIDDILGQKVIESLGMIITSSNGQFELLALSMGLISVFIDFDEQDRVVQKCQNQGIPEYVANLNTVNPQLRNHIETFLTRFNPSDMNN